MESGCEVDRIWSLRTCTKCINIHRFPTLQQLHASNHVPKSRKSSEIIRHSCFSSGISSTNSANGGRTSKNGSTLSNINCRSVRVGNHPIINFLYIAPQEKSVHCEQASRQKTPINIERVISPKKPMVQKRANLFKKTTLRERATHPEKTRFNKRASIYEKPIRIERASKLEKSMRIERAKEREKPTNGQRAIVYKKPNKRERVIVPKKTRNQER